MTKDEAQRQLERMNVAVNSAIRSRSEFMDKWQHLFAEFQIGETVVHAASGERTTVVAHYRYWAHHELRQRLVPDMSGIVEQMREELTRQRLAIEKLCGAQPSGHDYQKDHEECDTHFLVAHEDAARRA